MTIDSERATLDRDAVEPLWSQLAGLLRTAITAGELRPDQALPSEAELMGRFGISRTVVREALAELVRTGMIYKVRAKGSFVSPPSRDLRFVGSSAGSAADLTASGRTVVTRILNQEVIAADARAAEALDIDPGDEVTRLRRLRIVDGSPWLLVDTLIPRAVAPGLDRANLENRSLYEYLRRTHGIVAGAADRWLQAVIPDRESAALLSLPAGAPALHIESIAYDQDSRPFEFYRGLHRSDESRFYVGIR
ncbi:GntR family transcriptional regulator [Herbiconiux moechotypicola]|uniref:GntR family transcriptional regulator n=1 Tax=Herbiconiux moechotypicola TaxID=637393 RepID=A0ABN3DD42_9MICO|nr:GntR family transcriptional regulator [Herbiconiux moechotypicola]MCS5729155.1 GntR family transcriptional regulator [Herbiconiux moechotypicola]